MGTPEIRFHGFDGEWEEKKLSDIADKITQKNVDAEYEETLTNSAEYGIISQTDYFDRAVSNTENISGYYIVENNDFVYNPRISTSAPVGPINRNQLNRTGVMSPLYTVFRAHDIKETYLEWYFKSSHWHKYMFFHGDTGARADRFSIKDRVFFSMPIPMPQGKEQQKVGTYFSNLDSLITQFQKKSDSLNTVKQYMLQKMFPRNGQRVPEIRFSGFTGDWEENNLGDVCQVFRSGSFIPAKDIEEIGLYPVYGGNGLRGYTSDYNHDGEYALIGRQGALCGNVNYSIGKAYFTEHAIAVQANDTSDTRFLYFLLDKMSLGKYSGQSAQPGLAVGKLIVLKNMFPSKEEQEKIGSYFSHLDSLITQYQKKAEEFKILKKYMLQKMFV